MKNIFKNWKDILIVLLVLSTIGSAGLTIFYYGRIHGYDKANEPSGYVRVESQEVAEGELYEQDILERFGLPRFERMDSAEAQELVESLQVMQKIRKLGVDVPSILYPENNMAALENVLDVQKANTMNAPREEVEFDGTKGSELQKCIDNNQGKKIIITSNEIEVNQELDIPENTYLYGNNVKLTGQSKFLFMVEGVKNVVIDGFVINGGYDFGVYVISSSNVYVRNCIINSCNDKAITLVNDCQYIGIENNMMNENGQGGIYVVGNANQFRFTGNTVSNSKGSGNYMAGIVICCIHTVEPKDIWDPYPGNHWWPTKAAVVEDMVCPHNYIVEENTVKHNNSSGIYSDGSYLGFIVNNLIIENDKEGMCLDNGTFGCYVAENVVKENGRRIRQTDEALELDFVLHAGRMADGSANSKVPGISLDNAAYNMIIGNTVADNYGGGIKSVRTAVRNLIFENTLIDNNLGQGDVFHFFGVELGSASPDKATTKLDATPSYENIVARNTITGNHYACVFISTDGYCNDVFDNVLMDAGWFSVECISVKFNSIINNLSNRDMRNEYQP